MPLHRVGVVHRDVKPDNVVLTADGGLRLIDLGVAHAPRFDDFPEADAPGTPSFMAPELFAGQRGDEASDLYALGVTVYRTFAVAYPYGEIEPFTTPRIVAYRSLTRRRPELPRWGHVIEFAHELEAGLKHARPPELAPTPLYERNLLMVWKLATFALGV